MTTANVADIRQEVSLETAPPNLLIDQITDLPALPLVVAQSLSIMETDSLSDDALAQTLESDHALTVKLLRIANSPFCGLTQEILTVRDAIAIIGFEAVRSMAVSASAISGLWVKDDLFDANKFWAHSLGCALFGEAIARHLRTIQPESAFTLGILHDIGRIIMIQSLTDQYRKAIGLAKSAKMYLWKAEQEIFGFHHGEVGGCLAEHWHLPPVYSHAIRYHHRPEAAQQECVHAQLLELSDAMSHTAFPLERQDRCTQPLYRGLWEPLNLTEAIIRNLLNDRDRFDERTKSFIAFARLQ